MTRKSNRKKRRSGRRSYRDELKAEAVQMLLDGDRAESVASNLGLSGANLLYRWKAKLIKDSGPAATTLENRVRELEEELRRVERERDILKKRWLFSVRGCRRSLRGHQPIGRGRLSRVLDVRNTKREPLRLLRLAAR